MTHIQALLLGILQGITEFLPISSSGHLVIVQQLFGIKEKVLFFDVMLHLGTLVAVLVFFRRDIIALIAAVFGRDSDKWPGTAAQGRRVAAWVILGTIPAGVVGALLNDVIEKAFGSALFAGCGLLVTATVLALADRISSGDRDAASLGPLGAFIVGAAQAVAILPGVSRSGSTICASIFLKLERREAARFSFFLFIPAILGATVLELKKALEGGPPHLLPVLIGMAAAFFAGMFALNILMRVLTRGRLIWFSAYCAAAGIATILIFLLKG
jgi:undecaprenyl-diphosphatase